MATIQDVAREAQVSASAVSLVLNGRPGVSDNTRKRVEHIIRELNYRVPAAGRPLKRNTVYNLGVVYTSYVVKEGRVHPLSTSWISGFRSEAMEAGHHVSVFAALANVEQDMVFQRLLTDGQLHGAILIGMGADDGYFKALKARGLPMVVMNRRPAHGEFSYVAMDNYGAGRQVVEHFYKLGHRRIAHVRDNLALSFRLDRTAGFEAGLAEHGLKAACTEVVALPPVENIHEIGRRVVDSGATAVFLDFNVETPLLLNAWEQMGVRIPQDLSVIDFDDIGMRSAGGLRCTSVGFNKEGMGSAAARMLVELLESPDEAKHRSVVTPTYIVEYQTTGPARSPAK